ncbi:hypothetical protein AAKU61_000947 [Undibacterium sp. GrIS 1.2]|uniref:hypothetical protein n=1 Tax=Undibacterium sp. GrIS 1.2 TaxID=3143933 RepID=UPI00339A3098
MYFVANGSPSAPYLQQAHAKTALKSVSVVNSNPNVNSRLKRVNIKDLRWLGVNEKNYVAIYFQAVCEYDPKCLPCIPAQTGYSVSPNL